MRINNIKQNPNQKNLSNFQALRGIEYHGSFNPLMKPIDLEVLKKVQESKTINNFCRQNNVELYLSKTCTKGEYSSVLTFRYKKIANNFKEKLKNIFTPKNELNLMYKSKETSAEHSKTFGKLIQELKDIDLAEMVYDAPKKI